MRPAWHVAMHPPSGPLSGIRLLDLGTRVAAPFAATLLADLGAEVIKVELPGRGDFLRLIGPFVDGYSLFWAVENRGKKSITCDLRKAAGQALLRRLVPLVDVIVENFQPGTLESWGLGYEALAALNPGLVLTRVSVYGQTGPYRDRPGLARAMAREDLLADPRFTTLALRAEHGDVINAIVADWCRSRTAAEIADILVRHDVPFGVAYSAADIFADPHIAAREDLVAVDDPVIGPVRMQGVYPRFSRTPGAIRGGAPRLGAHNAEVYGELLGLSVDDLRALERDGVI